jgi:hypothetical protein
MTRKLSTDDVADVCRRYALGESAPLLGRTFNVSATAINGLLTRRGIARRSRVDCQPRRYTCNHAYFDAIDTEPKAYWLGFLAADGCVRKGRLQLCLAASDGAHIARFLAAIESDHVVYRRPFAAYRSGARDDVLIRSPQMYADLVRHGVLERKSLVLAWPTTLEPTLLRHYLRGYFDGDGYVKRLSSRRPTHAPSGVVGITSSLPFLAGCMAYLMDQLGFRAVAIYKPRPDAQFGYLAYGGNHQVRTFYDHLYEGATVWLARKREKMESLLAEANGPDRRTRAQQRRYAVPPIADRDGRRVE